MFKQQVNARENKSCILEIFIKLLTAKAKGTGNNTVNFFVLKEAFKFYWPWKHFFKGN